VATIEKLLHHMPAVGCKHCVFADPPSPIAVAKECTCEDLFLQSIGSLNWRPNNKTWFARQRRGSNWFKALLSNISLRAGLKKKYTNSCLRPSGITSLAAAGYSNREIAQFTGQKTHEVIEQYKRNLENLTADQKRDGKMLLCPSGRNLLRGNNNKWGEVNSREGGHSIISTNHKNIVQNKAGSQVVMSNSGADGRRNGSLSSRGGPGSETTSFSGGQNKIHSSFESGADGRRNGSLSSRGGPGREIASFSGGRDQSNGSSDLEHQDTSDRMLSSSQVI
jgi:hypothetical protein